MARTKCKCTTEKWCPVMAMAMSDSGRGMRVVNISDLEGKTVRTLATLFSGQFKPRGVVINYCPFCGTNLKKIHAEKKER